MPIGGGGGGGGVGGRPDDVRAGGAFVEVSLRDRFTKQFDALKAKTAGIDKYLSKGMGKVGGLLSPGKLLAGGAFGAAATAAGAYIGTKVIESISNTARQGQIAQALGLSPEQFSGIAGVAKSVGEDTREFLESLVTMGKLATDAVAGVGEVAGPAFEAMGLDAKEFIKLRADEQFFRIFDALNKVQDPLQRTRLLMNAFGEDGGKFLLPLLAKTPGQLRAMARGFEVSGEEMAKASKASVAFTALEVAVDRAWRAIATDVADPFEKMARNLERMVPLAKQFMANMIPAAVDKMMRFMEGLEQMATTLEKVRMAKPNAGVAIPRAEELPHIGAAFGLGFVDLMDKIGTVVENVDKPSFRPSKWRRFQNLTDEYAKQLNPNVAAPLVSREEQVRKYGYAGVYGAGKVDPDAMYGGAINRLARWGKETEKARANAEAFRKALDAGVGEELASGLFPVFDRIKKDFGGIASAVGGSLLKGLYERVIGSDLNRDVLARVLPLDAIGNAASSFQSLYRSFAPDNPFRGEGPNAGQVAAAVRGTFSGPLGMQLGGGGPVAKQQLDEMKKAGVVLGKLLDVAANDAAETEEQNRRMLEIWRIK